MESLASKATGSRALAGMYLVLPKDEEHPDVVVVAAAFLVYVRSGGFMVVVPPDEGVRLALARLEDPVSDAPVALHSGEVALESSRGRSVGVGDVELVDLPWTQSVASFQQALFVVQLYGRLKWLLSILRGATQVAIVLRRKPFRLWPMDGQRRGPRLCHRGRAQRSRASDCYSSGIGCSGATRQRGGSVEAEDSRVGISGSKPPSASAALKASPKAGQLFAPMQGAVQSSLTAADWSKLQMLAGSPPPRVGVGEKRRGRVSDTVRELEGAFANLEKEAEDPDEVPDLLAVLKEESTDPVHKLLAVQLRQNQALLEKLVGQKHSDPVLGALTGGETSSGSSSGVKGCLAPDAFIKAMQDLPKVVRVMRQQL